MHAHNDLARKDRWWDVLIAGAAIIAIYTVASRINATNWVEHLDILLYAALLAAVTGIALGYSRFSPLVTGLMSIIYSVFIIGWLLGTTVSAEMTWHDRIIYQIGWRLRTAIAQFGSGQPSSDPILFLALISLLLWILASSATYMLIREGSAWPALVPLGIALLVIGHYDPNQSLNLRYLAVFLLAVLLIVGRMTYLQYQEKWHLDGIHTTPETRKNFIRALTVTSTALLLIAWMLPVSVNSANSLTIFWNQVTENWQDLTQRVVDIFTFDSEASEITAGYFDDAMALGTNIPLSDQILFTVTIDSHPPAGYRHYWRARSYDHYEGSTWSTSLTLSKKSLTPDEFNLQHPASPTSQAARYTFSSRQDQAVNLYYTGLPTWISRPVSASTYRIDQQTEDLIGLAPELEITIGERYQLETLAGVPSAVILRESETDYPGWIDPYLQLPQDFSADIADLALSIAGNSEHPYDIAFTMTRYLRSNIDYSATIPLLPAGTDPIEWFLFDGQTGFCNYYATAQVLMLRSLGIPARIAVGYTQGDFNQQNETYTVRRRNSHAWPEVYFVDVGWVIFEPTAAERDVFFSPRLTAEENTTRLMNDLPMADDPANQTDTTSFEVPIEMAEDTQIGDEETLPTEQSRRGLPAIIALTLLIIIAGTVLIGRKWMINNQVDSLPVWIETFFIRFGWKVPKWVKQWQYAIHMSATERAFQQLNRSIRIMGQTINKAATPMEQARFLIDLLPESKQAAWDLVREYQFDQFSQHRSNDLRARIAARQLIRLSVNNRLQWIITLGGRI